MRRVSIGRLIFIGLAVTVVSLMGIDTARACRWLWRHHRAPCPEVVYCPPVIVCPSPCEPVGCQAGSTTEPVPAEAPQADQLAEPPAPPSEPPPPPAEVEAPAEQLPTEQLPPEEPTPEPPVAAPPEQPAEPPAEQSLPDLPQDLELPTEPEQPAPDTSNDLLEDLLPSDNRQPDTTLPPPDNSDDDLGDLFDATPSAPPESDQPADSSPQPGDDLLEDLPSLDNGTDTTPAPADSDNLDDLFPTDSSQPAETPDAIEPADGGEQPNDGGDVSDDLDDLFGQSAPARDRQTSGFREVTKPAVEQSATHAVGYRQWTDNTGQYRTNARLVRIATNHVRLLKANGHYSTVPLQRLSRVDLAYVQQIAASGGVDSLGRVAQR